MIGRIVRKSIVVSLLAIAVTFCLGQAMASSPKLISVACTGEPANTIALGDDGSVWAWGNDYGTSPVQVQIDNVAAISAGNGHVLAIRSDGSVWVWGYNTRGVFGDGTTGTGFVSVPQQVPGLENVVAISAGNMHSIALENDGTVWSWGQNNFGQLGDGTYENQLTPAQITGLPPIKAIGGHGLFAIGRDGSVWTWGPGLLNTPNNNVTGEDDQALHALSRPSPFLVPGIGNVTSIDADLGATHVVFVKSDGTVWSWGNDEKGVFGDNNPIYYNFPYVTVPVQAKGIGDVVQVAATLDTSLALKSDGTVWAWGLNGAGVQGTGTIGHTESIPVKVSGLSSVVSIAVGEYSAAAVEADGSVWGWGNGYVGPNGQGQNGYSPIMAIGSSGVVNVVNTTNGTATVTTPTESAAASGGQSSSGYSGNLLLAGVLAVAIIVCIALIVLAGRKKQ